MSRYQHHGCIVPQTCAFPLFIPSLDMTFLGTRTLPRLVDRQGHSTRLVLLLTIASSILSFCKAVPSLSVEMSGACSRSFIPTPIQLLSLRARLG